MKCERMENKKWNHEKNLLTKPSRRDQRGNDIEILRKIISLIEYFTIDLRIVKDLPRRISYEKLER